MANLGLSDFSQMVVITTIILPRSTTKMILFSQYIDEKAYCVDFHLLFFPFKLYLKLKKISFSWPARRSNLSIHVSSQDWNTKVRTQEISGVTGKFGLGVQNEAGQRLIEFCQDRKSTRLNSSHNA